MFGLLTRREEPSALAELNQAGMGCYKFPLSLEETRKKFSILYGRRIYTKLRFPHPVTSLPVICYYSPETGIPAGSPDFGTALHYRI
jgi:hypothetical protein